MKFIDLFAGIGGFSLGLERAGMVCAAQVEIDPYCQRVLAKHWPDVTRFGDVHDVGKENLPEADLICGGFPCQPHSLAGKRRGAADDRDLWPEFRRIIGECQPTWAIGENVIGIRTTILDQALSDLESMGYSTRTFWFPACGLDAPHRRDRIFIIAHANGGEGNIPVSARDKGAKLHTGGDGAVRTMANANNISSARQRANRGEIYARPETNRPSCRSELLSDAVQQGLAEREAPTEGSLQIEREDMGFGGQTNQWAVEPRVGRVADGVPHRVDRLRGLGNAVVPQVVALFGRAIMEVNDDLG